MGVVKSQLQRFYLVGEAFSADTRSLATSLCDATLNRLIVSSASCEDRDYNREIDRLRETIIDPPSADDRTMNRLMIVPIIRSRNDIQNCAERR